MEEFRAAKGLKARVAVASELLKNASDLTDKAAAATEVIAALNAEIASHQRTQPAVALEAIFVRDDIREMAGVAARRRRNHRRGDLGAGCEARPAAGAASGVQASPGAGIVQGRESRALARRRCRRR